MVANLIPNATNPSAKWFSKSIVFSNFDLKCSKISTLSCIFFFWKSKTTHAVIEFFCCANFISRLLNKIFSANAASIDPSFFHRFFWNLDQNLLDSPIIRLSSRKLNCQWVHSQLGILSGGIDGLIFLTKKTHELSLPRFCPHLTTLICFLRRAVKFVGGAATVGR